MATVFLVTLALTPPALAYAGLVPNLIFQITFGALSGYVSGHVVRAMSRSLEALGPESANQPSPIDESEIST